MPRAESAPLPSWLKTRLPVGRDVERVRASSRARGLHTVCEEARCPNRAECWGAGAAAFMALGGACTRGCRFCSVPTAARPAPPDPAEPGRLAEAVAELGLGYAVLTAVCRDDLPDQGAGHLAACVRALRERVPGLLVEVLLQDFRGDEGCLRTVLDAGPAVAAHNLETVERLTRPVRDRRAGYQLSLGVLRAFKRLRPRARTKSSLMLGFGETREELLQALADLRAAGVDVLTLGQYLRPGGGPRHLPVVEFVTPEEFGRLGDIALSMGFKHVASGPFARSSYRAWEALA